MFKYLKRIQNNNSISDDRTVFFYPLPIKELLLNKSNFFDFIYKTIKDNINPKISDKSIYITLTSDIYYDNKQVELTSLPILLSKYKDDTTFYNEFIRFCLDLNLDIIIKIEKKNVKNNRTKRNNSNI